MTLAEILSKAKKLEGELNNEFACALVGVAQRRDAKRARRVLDAFYVEHFPRLARVAEAVNEAIGDKLPTGSIPPCHRCTALRDALRAAVRGEEKTK